ncbi:hypothetical protein JTE90_029072 [Oedothorax gibbosus]|uniref:Uncharacterized protein n=1 Tax=Oedothorax gibbosus TaxID=931172 RepID=A0AAV6UWE4_9ARAC|nr:hypothetical protein JTE90_029072 [Oedothorax gibbosus]
MSLWLILVTLPASFFRMLRYVLNTSIWTRFMKNRITQTEPSNNEEIRDIDTVEGFCDSDSCNSSVITSRPQSDIPNLSSVSEKNGKSNEDEFYSESSIDKQNVSVANLLVDKRKEFISEDRICVSAHQTITTSHAEKDFTITYNMIVNRHSSNILTKYKHSNCSEINYEISSSVSGDEITTESGDDVTNVKLNREASDKFTDEEFGDKISDNYADKITNVRFIEASSDETTVEASGDELLPLKQHLVTNYGRIW